MIDWKDRIKQQVQAGGTGTIVLAPATVRYASLGSSEHGKSFYYYIEDGPNWEVGSNAVYNDINKTITRGSIDASSNGNLPINVSTSAFFYVDLTAKFVKSVLVDSIVRKRIPAGIELRIPDGYQYNVHIETFKIYGDVRIEGDGELRIYE